MVMLSFFCNGSACMHSQRGWVCHQHLKQRLCNLGCIKKGHIHPTPWDRGMIYISAIYCFLCLEFLSVHLCAYREINLFLYYFFFCFSFLPVCCDYCIFSCFLVQNGSELWLLVPFFPALLGSFFSFFFLLAFLFVNCVHSGYC